MNSSHCSLIRFRYVCGMIWSHRLMKLCGVCEKAQILSSSILYVFALQPIWIWRNKSRVFQTIWIKIRFKAYISQTWYIFKCSPIAISYNSKWAYTQKFPVSWQIFCPSPINSILEILNVGVNLTHPSRWENWILKFSMSKLEYFILYTWLTLIRSEESFSLQTVL